MAARRIRRPGPLAWVVAAALLLAAAVGLYAVFSAEPASVTTEEQITVPQAPTPTPLMKPET